MDPHLSCLVQAAAAIRPQSKWKREDNRFTERNRMAKIDHCSPQKKRKIGRLVEQTLSFLESALNVLEVINHIS